MSQDEDLDALLRSTLRQEAEPTGYRGGLTGPVLHGVRKRRQRRVIAAAAGGAAALALVTGSILTLDSLTAEQPIRPAASSAGHPSPTHRVTHTGLASTSPPAPPPISTAPPAPTASEQATAEETATETPDGTATDWSSLPEGQDAAAFIAFRATDSSSTLTWGGQDITVPLAPSGAPALRTVHDGQAEYLLIRDHDPANPLHATAGVDDVHVVGKDGSARKLFTAVTGSTVQSPHGDGLVAAYSLTTHKVEVRRISDGTLTASFDRPETQTPMTWGRAGIVLRGGDVVSPQGAVALRVPDVRMAATSGNGTSYAVTGTSVIRVASSGAATVGPVLPGTGNGFPAAAPGNDFLATTGGVMDLSTGSYVVRAQGTVQAIQWVDESHVVFVREGENVRCDVVARRCESAQRRGLSPFSLLSW